jgi:uncharacterized LabA/DUF88 family protein
MPEPAFKRAWAFFDGQNLYHAAKEAFGYRLPNYDVQKLARRLCEERGWSLTGTHFYTGIPDAADNPFWNQFWSAKLAFMGRQGVRIYSRKLRYRNQTVKTPDGEKYTFLVGQEKGIDIRIALDVVRAVHRDECDVALLFSQDQDLSEVADEVRLIAHEQRRWIKIASAFPFSPTIRNKRGINKTDWIPIHRAAYDACLDKTIF